MPPWYCTETSQGHTATPHQRSRSCISCHRIGGGPRLKTQDALLSNRKGGGKEKRFKSDYGITVCITKDAQSVSIGFRLQLIPNINISAIILKDLSKYWLCGLLYSTATRVSPNSWICFGSFHVMLGLSLLAGKCAGLLLTHGIIYTHRWMQKNTLHLIIATDHQLHWCHILIFESVRIWFNHRSVSDLCIPRPHKSNE